MKAASIRTRILTSAAALAAALVVGTSPLVAQGPTTERGAAALGSLLGGLGTTGRVLTVAAHPDDEDTQFITWLARGRHVETAYLSLTRGDGGQNLIGNELGEALGVIRTQELMAARRIDGGRQYFTRAYDFGFSKNAEETYEHWPKDSILGDVVRVVRAFRPHVVVAFFSGTPRDGHGHHQVSGLLAREAYDAAGDTVRFPVAGYGLPWTPAKFYRSARQDPASGTLRMNVGEYDPLLGRSYFEIAAESRSQHKSQGFGVLQRKGVIWSAVRREDARVGPADPRQETSLFDGIDTSWTALRPRVPAAARPVLDSALRTVADVRAAYRATDPTPLVQPLANALRQFTSVRRASGAAPAMLLTGRPGFPPMLSRRFPNAIDLALYDALTTAMARVEQALVLAAGIAVEATAPHETFPVREAAKVNVSDSLPVTITVFNRGRTTVTFNNAGAGAAGRVRDSTPQTRELAPDSAHTVERHAVAFESTSPWWRFAGRKGRDWFMTFIDARDEALQQARTQPTAQAYLVIAGQPVVVSTPIVNRYADPIKGDQQTPVAAVPGITVNLQSAMEYIRAGVPVARPLQVRIQSAYTHEAKVSVKLELPKGLVADSVERVRTLPARGSTTIVFNLRGTIPEGRHQLAAIAMHDESFSTSGSYTIAYDHITPVRMYGSSGMYLSAVSVKLPPRARVGYIVGVGDAGMDALRQLDVAVEKIEPSMLGGMDLSRFTSIVVGPRAYESSEELVRANPRLLDYARRGGSLVVQYGAQNMSRFPTVLPFPLGWTQPAARVTMENAPVRILRADAPLLTTPNRIAERDWADWVQERATYMPSTIAPQYTSFLSMNDPEEPEQRGALLQARLGRGTYTYVTLALFRQLPNGVPGAARLLLNLVNGTPPAAATPPKM